MRFLITLFTLSLAGAASAQSDKVWTPAPVPGDSPGAVTPADRAGSGSSRSSDAGPDTSTPFSASPSGLGGSQSNPSSGDTAPGRASETPNLSR